MERKTVVSASKALNETGYALFQIDIKLKGQELFDEFISACETIPADKEDLLPDLVTNTFNALVDGQDGEMDITDIAMEARKKESEMKKEKKETVKEPKKETKPVKEKVTKPVKEKVEKVVKEKVEKPKPVKEKKEPTEKGMTKANMAMEFVRNNPGATMYQLKQQDWNTANDAYYNLFNKKILEGIMRKDGKGYYLNETV